MFRKEAEQKLLEIFGYSKFREDQYEIIEQVLLRKNSVVIMPTGSGKSICYQIPALMLEGLAVVISPLISLMKDQVMQLQELGINAAFLNSSLSRDEYRNVVIEIEKNEIDILYLAPETLTLYNTIELLKSIKVEFLAIDEAHCISEWGHDFRPEYRQIANICSELGNLPIIALTATATPQVQADISQNLGLKEFTLFKASFNRSNLFLSVTIKSNPENQVFAFLDKYPNQPSIIYCFSRKRVDDLAEKLVFAGYTALPYHAGLSNQIRKTNQERFIKDDVQIIVATVAFGMGINKPDIRTIIHYDMPKDIESYYQQIGRAGRDGENAYCLLLFGYQDVAKIKYLLQEKEGQELKNGYQHLDSMMDFIETEDCRRIVLLNYFGEEYQLENCHTCDNCLQTKKAKEDITVHVQKFLSCIYRTDQFFGSNHIIKILRGSKDKAILAKRHDEISTYGIGRDLSSKQWLHLFRQLVRAKIIFVDQSYGSLKLTEKANFILRGKEPFLGNLIEEKTFTPKAEIIKDYDLTLFELLKEKRKELADAKNIPPYAVFHNKTLAEICSYFPKSKEELSKISGIGKAKLAKYGNILLKIILPYYQENNIQSKFVASKNISKNSGKIKRFIEVGNLFNEGISMAELQNKFQVQEETILAHIHKFVSAGNALKYDLKPFLTIDSNMFEKVTQKLSEQNELKLSTIYSHFEGKISYRDLKICQLILLNELNNS